MDRIKAHRSAPDVYDPPTFDQMADRIKQLEEGNKELTLQLLATSGQAADAWDKLTKTVEALRDTTQMLSQCTFTIIRMKGQYFERHEVVDNANAVLADLRGTK
jgi:hypothetical protein